MADAGWTVRFAFVGVELVNADSDPVVVVAELAALPG
jgi:hypothetical protein